MLCDWISIYQDHPQGGLPIVNDGAVFKVDTNGEIAWTTEAKFDQVGSYDTNIRIKCDGYRVALDGNIGRFNRTDNVFGYSVIDCIRLANDLLATFGIQPFSLPSFNTSRGKLTGGAILTRIDLTKNYEAGSYKKATRIVHYLAGQDGGRRATVKQYGNDGVTWNEGSKYHSSKLYIKSQALGVHCTEQLKEWVTSIGMVRHEVSIKARYLAQQKLRHINDWLPTKEGISMENVIYNRFSDVLTRGTASLTPLEHIPKKLGHLAIAWRAGKDLWNDSDYNVATRRRWRSQLLQYGIDIKQPSNITRLPIRLELVTLQEVSAPAWYWQESRAA